MRYFHKVLILTICLIFSICCTKNNQNDFYDDKLAIIADSTEINQFKLIQGKYQFWQPNKNELVEIEKILKKEMFHHQNKYSRHLSPDSLHTYFRQYVCFVDKKGKKSVYINAFCYVHDNITQQENGKIKFEKFDWKKHWQIITDGGDCYWRAELNYSEKRFLHFWVNGVA